MRTLWVKYENENSPSHNKVFHVKEIDGQEHHYFIGNRSETLAKKYCTEIQDPNLDFDLFNSMLLVLKNYNSDKLKVTSHGVNEFAGDFYIALELHHVRTDYQLSIHRNASMTLYMDGTGFPLKNLEHFFYYINSALRNKEYL